MIRFIKKIFPGLAPSIHIILGFLYDAKKFINSSASFQPEKDKEKLRALITRQYHGIEKALTLPKPRLGFGQDLVQNLIQNTTQYYSAYGFDSLVKTALDNLIDYQKFNEDCNQESLKRINVKINSFLERVKEYDHSDENKSGGHYLIEKKDWQKKSKTFDYETFVKTRVSIRDFSSKEVENITIKKALLLAQETPSACNREPWKVRVFKGDEKDFILEYQNGNRGFSKSINTVLLITADKSPFSYYERHGAWVNGGLYAMSLIYAFHSLGIGVCALNTSYTLKAEKSLRKAISLPDKEEPIMMLGVGHVKERFKVAKSSNRSLAEVLVKSS